MSAETNTHPQLKALQSLKDILKNEPPITTHISPTLSPIPARSSSTPPFHLDLSSPVIQPVLGSTPSPLINSLLKTTYPPVVRMLNEVGRYHYYTVQGSSVVESTSSPNVPFTMTQSSLSLPSPIFKVASPAMPAPEPPQLHNPQEELDPEELELATSVLKSLNTNFTREASSNYSWKGEVVHPFVLEKLCLCVQRLLYKEHALIDLSSGGSPVCIFGDIHGEYRDLRRFTDLLKIEQATQCEMKFLFLGDYVDRGPHPVEVVAYLFALKVLHPNNVFMLSGNHEHSNYVTVRDPAGTYRLYKDIVKLYGKAKGKDVYNAMVAAFGVLPWAATIDGDIFCSHGGFPRYASQEELAASLEKMRTQSPLDDPYYETLSMIPFQDVMYSDPILEDPGDVNSSSGGDGSSDVVSSDGDGNLTKSQSALMSPSGKVQATAATSPPQSPTRKGATLKRTAKKSLGKAGSQSSKMKGGPDPFPKGFCKNVHRKGRDDFPCSFTKEAFDGFCSAAKVSFLIRAHQHFDGYTGLRYEKRLFTIFTSTELFEVNSKRTGQAIIYYGKAFHVIVLDAEQASVST